MHTLDIIVTHYNESWEVGKKFFDMLDLQRGVDFSQLHVILVHDGSEAFPETYFWDRPYPVKQVCIPHGGVSAARNAGIRNADAEWISFSDFDDVYYGVLSLKYVMDILPTAENFDMLAADFIEEDRLRESGYEYHVVKNDDMIFIHGKYFRLDILRQHSIWFDESMEYNEDGYFNALVYSYLKKGRRGVISTPGPVYMWCFRENSLTSAVGTRWKASLGLYWRNRKITDDYEKRMSWKEYCQIAARTIVDAYYIFHYLHAETSPGYEDLLRDFHDFYMKHRKLIEEVEPEIMQKIRKITREEHETDPKINDRYLFNKVELKEDIPSFWNWIDEMDRKITEEVEAHADEA